MSSPIRSDRSFGATRFLRICHSRRLSAKLELPDSLGPTILKTPRSGKAPLECLARDLWRTLPFAPDGREPPLLVARQSRRAVVMPHLQEPGCGDVIAPGVVIEEAAIAITAKAFLVVSSRV